MENNIKPVYRRILLKISGESLQGKKKFGIDINTIKRLSEEIKKIIKLGVQTALMIGGGNLFRGSLLAKNDINKVTCDQVGMLSTIINGLIFKESLYKINVKSNIMSSIPLHTICNAYNWINAIDCLIKNNVLILVGGLGNPLFTTDTAACLRGIEIKADIIIKATKVDGIFSKDPIKNSNAQFYQKLSYNDVLKKKLKIMDFTAFILAKKHNIPIRVININKPGILKKIIIGYNKGSLITN